MVLEKISETIIMGKGTWILPQSLWQVSGPLPLVSVLSLSGEVQACGPVNRELVEQEEPRPIQEVASMV